MRNILLEIIWKITDHYETKFVWTDGLNCIEWFIFNLACDIQYKLERG